MGVSVTAYSSDEAVEVTFDIRAYLAGVNDECVKALYHDDYDARADILYTEAQMNPKLQHLIDYCAASPVIYWDVGVNWEEFQAWIEANRPHLRQTTRAEKEAMG